MNLERKITKGLTQIEMRLPKIFRKNSESGKICQNLTKRVKMGDLTKKLTNSGN